MQKFPKEWSKFSKYEWLNEEYDYKEGIKV